MSDSEKILLKSSNKVLEEAFRWAAEKAASCVMTGKSGVINRDENHPEGDDKEIKQYIPSYWAGYCDRSGFYSRDFVHQAAGAGIIGLWKENYSMFKAFAGQCTESRKWYTLWALNFDGSPLSIDYRGDHNFVRIVPAQFELVEKAYKQYLWSGDRRYLEDETLWNFYTKVVTEYINIHDKNGNGIAQEVGTGIFDGLPTYNERKGQYAIIEAGDGIASQYQALHSYAAMLGLREEWEESRIWHQKAENLKKYFNEKWSIPQEESAESCYVCARDISGRGYTEFMGETSWFIPLKMLSEPGERNDAYLDFILKNLGEGIGSISSAPHNIEAYTYIPDMLFLYNRPDEAWKWMKYITGCRNQPHERPEQGTNGDYPEISFTFVSQVIEGMLGIMPNGGENLVATAPQLPQEVENLEVKGLKIGEGRLELCCVGNQYSRLTNCGGKPLIWEAGFYGDYLSIQVENQLVEAQHKWVNGCLISYVTIEVQCGDTVVVQAG